jgi:hypothetical protein
VVEAPDKKLERTMSFGLKRNDKKIFEYSWKESMNLFDQ